MPARNPFLGSGMAFPFRFSTNTGGVAVSTDEERINQAIDQILGTPVGSRVMRRDFGSRLREVVFRPSDPTLARTLEHHTRKAIERWEKRIRITSVSAALIGDAEGRVDITIHYYIIDTNVPGNYVYPFYPRESPGDPRSGTERSQF